MDTGQTDQTDQSDGNEGFDGSGWPQFGRDVRNAGYAPAATATTSDPTVEWRFDAGTPTMNTSPVVAGGTVYVAGSGDPGSLYAVDAASGESRWQFEPAGYATSAPAVVAGVLYVGTWGRRFYAIDAATGEERWSTEVGHRFGPSSPAVVDGTVYVGTIGDGPLVVSGPEDEEKFEACAFLALDAATGDELWRYDEFGERDRISSSPAVSDGRVYFGGEDAVYALDAASGEVVWKRTIATHPRSSPAVVDGTVYYGATLGSAGEHPARVWSLDAATGETVWSAGIDDGGLRTSPAVADGTVYVPASSVRVCADAAGDADSTCSGTTRGRLYAIDASSGERRWRAPIETDTRSSPAVANSAFPCTCWTPTCS